MLARNAVRGCAIIFGAALLFGAAGANAQTPYYSSLDASGPYANMPGQPGAPPSYMLGNNTMHPAPVSSPQAVMQEPGVVASSTEPVPAEEAPLPPPPPPPSPPQPIIYHSQQKEPPPSPLLETRSGIDIGVQVSDYHFREPGAGLEISGINYGGVLGVTGVVGDHFFGTLEGRYSAGWFDYTGTGSTHNQPNELWDVRGLLGKDFIYEYFSLSPFTGLGFEHDGSDINGTSSTGAALYERDNDLLYVPIGIRPRFRLDDQSRLTSMIEYDIPLQGEYTSHLGDMGHGDPSVRDDDRSGYGIRGEIMYETKYWSFGPFANYWNFDTSNPSVYHSPGSTCGSTTCSLVLPANHTIEAGVQLKLHLF